FVNLTENIGYIHSGGAKIKSNNNILYSIWQTLIEEPWNRDIFFTKKGVTIAIDNRYNEINFSLNQNYPNPFNPETIIKYSIPKRTNIKMLVYNILGKRIAELVNEEKTAGDYEITFNAEELNL